MEGLRNFNWAVSYAWEVQIESPPPRFEGFIPANNVSFPLIKLGTIGWKTAFGGFDIPLSEEAKGLSVELYDTDTEVWADWLKAWQERWRSEEGRNGYVEEVSKRITVHAFSREKTTKTRQFLVLPVGEVSWKGSQASSARTIVLAFAVLKEFKGKEIG